MCIQIVLYDTTIGFCLPLIWLARVVYLLVGAAEGSGGPGYAVLRYGVGVGAGVMRISERRFVALLVRRVSIDKRSKLEIYLGLAAVALWCLCWGVGGVFVGVGMLDCCMLLVASMWYQDWVFVQGVHVWVPCRCWSLRVSNVGLWDCNGCNSNL